MIKSMTGYASESFIINSTKFIVEIKSVNSKILDLNGYANYNKSDENILKHYAIISGATDDDEKNNITNQLKKSLGEKLSLNFNVDEDIIGGLIVKVGSKMIDTSIANKINKLKISELKDIAIEYDIDIYKVSTANTKNKFKTKNELSEEIKNYIINQNNV